MPYKPSEREYRYFLSPFAVTDPAASSEKKFATECYVEGMATTFNAVYDSIDPKSGKLVKEMIAPGALDGCDLSDVIMQYDHEGKVFARTSNNTLFVEARPEGLFIAADLSKSKAARDIYEEIAAGLITKMSFSFVVAKSHYDPAGTRVIDKLLKVYDVSAVSIPANTATGINARTVDRGSTEATTQELRRERRKRIALLIEIDQNINNGGM